MGRSEQNEVESKNLVCKFNLSSVVFNDKLSTIVKRKGIYKKWQTTKKNVKVPYQKRNSFFPGAKKIK